MKLYQATPWGWNPTTNNTYYDENNHIVYKVHTPFKLSNRTTTITKTRESERVFSPNTGNIATATRAGNEFGEEYNLVEFHKDSSSLRRHQSDSGLRRRQSDSEPESARSSIDIDGKSVSGWAEDVDVDGQNEASSSSSSPRVFEYLAQIDWKFFASSRFRFGDGSEIEAKAFFRKEGWGPYGRHRVFTARDGREYKWYLRYWYSELALNNEEKTPVAKFHRRTIGKYLPGKGPPAYLEIYPAGEHLADEIFTTFIYIEKLRKEKERAARHHDG